MLLPDSALRSMRVMFATPCYISSVSMNYVTSLYSLAYSCAQLGMATMLHMRSESLITRARNRTVKDFLADESFTHLFWIDSDIAFTPEAVYRILLADRDVASGVYPLKTNNWPAKGLPAGMTYAEYERRYTNYAFNPIGQGEEPLRPYIDEDGFIEVAEATTGFMAIKRDVFLRMMKHYPELQYTPDGREHDPLAHLYWLFFDCMLDPDSRRYLSEDYAFCRRWRDMGGKVYADLHSRLNHLGQHTFAGDFHTSLQLQGLI
ncbi:hypothetical protein [Methylobacterium sp. J-076]|uniref:hypothetical protein n=1 Tax=Methylobacterium sp. J-076 TaxID=2836655 RepID=UPI001FBB2AD9|nr:hypothetical protein [Methylobacterium sp. J-076]MCJ2013418.1 hypothetical protein [Methylobacterium sp. J-076]